MIWVTKVIEVPGKEGYPLPTPFPGNPRFYKGARCGHHETPWGPQWPRRAIPSCPLTSATSPSKPLLPPLPTLPSPMCLYSQSLARLGPSLPGACLSPEDTAVPIVLFNKRLFLPQVMNPRA